MNKEATDLFHVEVTRVSFRTNLAVGNEIWAAGRFVGHVAELHHKRNGEQAQIITDIPLPDDATEEDCARVKQVVVLFAGSSMEFGWHGFADWVLNDFPLAIQMVANAMSPKKVLFGVEGKTFPTPQLITSAQTLKAMMAKYPNAMFDVYGHSLGSMDAQYAMASVTDPDRLRNGYVYEGPNVYSTLNQEQREMAAVIKDRVFNFIDEKDVVPIASILYRPGAPAIGTVIRVASKRRSMGRQHMWGGYQFDENEAVLKHEFEPGLND